MINPDKLRARLIHEGLEETNHLEDKFLINKHIDRYLKSFRFLRANNLPLSSLMLTKLYRADVVVRQEMLKVLMPIELSIVSKLKYYLEENNISFFDITNTSIFEDFLLIPKEIRKTRWVNNQFVLKTFNALFEKWKTNEIKLLIDKMSFGQVAALIKALPENASQYIMGVKKSESNISLKNIISIRNYIAHLGQLFINNGLQISYKVSLPNLVDHIAVTAYGSYATDLKIIVDNYAERVIAKNIDAQQTENLVNLFEVIKSKLFGV